MSLLDLQVAPHYRTRSALSELIAATRYEDGKHMFRIADWYEEQASAFIVQVFNIIKETPHTYVVQERFCTPRRMYKKAHRRFAHTTVLEAVKAYLIRKQRHEQHAKARLSAVVFRRESIEAVINTIGEGGILRDASFEELEQTERAT